MKSKSKQRGFTVLELIITLALGVILIAAAYAVYISQHKGFERIEEITNVLQSARMSIDQLSRELRMAGFGVVTGETFSEAKKYSINFYGDVDTDISGVLAEAAEVGDTEIKIDLNDSRDTVEAGDYIFINGGGNVEMVQVKQSGEAVDLDGEPDTIYLNAPLANAYPAAQSLVRSIEQVHYAITFPAGQLKRNDVLLAEDLQDLEFHYFGDESQELVPDPVNGLNQIERAAIRRVEVRLTAGREGGPTTRTIVSTIDLRNMGNRPFKADTCDPNAPSGLMVTKSDMCEQFTITWTAPTANSCDGSSLTDLGGYKIYYGIGSGNYYIPPSNVSDETLTEYTVNDLRLANGVTYYVTMIAYDQSFNESSEATEIYFTLNDTDPPSPPQNVNAMASVGSVTLIWEASADEDVKGYRLYRGTEPGFTANEGTRIADENTLETETLSYTDDGLEPCKTYYYKISAVDCANEGEVSEEVFGDGGGPEEDSPTSNITNTTPTESPAVPPGRPEPFQAIARNEAVDLQWTNPGDSDFAGVIIRYSTVSFPTSHTDGEEFGEFEGSPSQVMTQTHSNLVNGTTYYYSAFPVDHCGNVGPYAYANAKPGGQGPVVEILAPNNGITIENGLLEFQAKAYDPDQTGLHEPPSVDLDNGAGISSVVFYVNPYPGYLQFPRVEYTLEYCGFGGDQDPCSTGSITSWCDGTYQLYAVAFDDEGSSGSSPYISVIVHNGGLYLDETYTPSAGGTYDNEITFKLKNDADNSATLQEIQTSWDHQGALLKRIEIPVGTTVWDAGTHPRSSGDVESLTYGSQPVIAANSTKTAKFVFTRTYTTLALQANAGDEYIRVTSWSGFSQGDNVYVTDGSDIEQVTISSIDGDLFNLLAPLENTYSYGATVRHTENADDVQMSNSEVRTVFTYQKSLLTIACQSDEIAVTFAAGPQLTNVQQDKPTEDLNCSTIQGQVQVENYRTVPVHAEAIDHARVGISSVNLYYFVDHSFQTVVPSSGYASLSMAYDSSDDRYEVTVPYQSNARVWFYLIVTDASNGTDRSPVTGAYAYDYVTDTTPPACPLGITATTIAKKQVNLSWVANSEPDVQGYNIYRSSDCGSYSRVYTRVTDSDPNTPGVQFIDDDNRLDTTKYCYTYYINAVDQQGNESGSCQTFTTTTGDCPCP